MKLLRELKITGLKIVRSHSWDSGKGFPQPLKKSKDRRKKFEKSIR